MPIGHWVHRARLTDLRPETRAHLVESEISDRLVMRCGRELRAPTGTTFAFESPDAPSGVGHCRQCGANRQQ